MCFICVSRLMKCLYATLYITSTEPHCVHVASNCRGLCQVWLQPCLWSDCVDIETQEDERPFLLLYEE